MHRDNRKSMRLAICSRDQWVPNEAVSTCSRCDKKFSFIVRRKHHCRGCGYIFCSEYAQCKFEMLN